MHFTLLPWARLFQVCYNNYTLLYIREKAGSKEMNQPLFYNNYLILHIRINVKEGFLGVLKSEKPECTLSTRGF